MPVWAWGMVTFTETGNWALVLAASAALILLGVPLLTAVQRFRHRALLGVDIPRPAPVPQRWSWASAARRLSATRPWRRLGYHLLLGPLLAVLELSVLVLAIAGLAGATAGGWVWALPVGVRQDWFGYTAQLPCYTVGGLALLCVVPWTAGAVARSESRLTLVLLGPSRAQRLQQRVDSLADSRTDLIEAVDAERRRIERDLHDGTQQRLVSLAVNLGLAMATRTDLSGGAGEVPRRLILRRRRRSPNSTTWCAGCTRRYSKTAGWTRRCPVWPPGYRYRSAYGWISTSGSRRPWSRSPTS
ncbi:sensor domain-containing protein [Streptomyces sp. NPDC059095]|uniref:sensor domain-containing protein n=1 Tax=Streptomyces sp. NPDC059095 TaxID=3346726 RepID=UPI0036A3B2B8